MGLGALYLLHVLAQDYMKIRKPAAKLAKFFLTKRDLDAVTFKENEKVRQSDCLQHKLWKILFIIYV